MHSFLGDSILRLFDETIFSPGLNDKTAQPVVKPLLPAHHQMGWQLHRIVSEMVLLSFAPLCPNGNSPASRLFHSGWNHTLLSLLYSGITFIHKATILSIAGEFRNTWFFNLTDKLIELVASGKLRQGSTTPSYLLSSDWVQITTISSERSSISLITDRYSTPTPHQPMQLQQLQRKATLNQASYGNQGLTSLWSIMLLCCCCGRSWLLYSVSAV